MDTINILQALRDYSWEKDAWFLGLAPALEGVTPEEAAWQPPGGGNTIWQTLNHLNFYNERILKEIKGLDTPPSSMTNTATFGDPGDPNDSDGWYSTLQKTNEIASDLKEALNTLKVEELEKDDFGSNLLSWIMHDSYHTGQIVLLRKMQSSWPAERE